MTYMNLICDADLATTNELARGARILITLEDVEAQ